MSSFLRLFRHEMGQLEALHIPLLVSRRYTNCSMLRAPPEELALILPLSIAIKHKEHQMDQIWCSFH